MAKYGSVYLSSSSRDFFLSLHSLANLPTQLGKSPYTAWQISLHSLAEPLFHGIELSRIFGRIFRLQVFFTSFFTSSSTRVPSLVAVGTEFMKTVIHNFTYSLIHELNSS
jgi:hypothetical protein